MKLLLAAAQLDWIALSDVIANWVLAIAAVVGGFFAWRGLDTWRHQLAQQTQSDLARRVLKAVYELEYEIFNARCPMISSSEQANAVKALNVAISDPADFNAAHTERIRATWIMRRNTVVEKWNTLKVESFEARAVHGDTAQDSFNAVSECVRSLIGEIDFYVDMWVNPNVGALDKEQLAQKRQSEEVIYRRGREEMDEYRQRLKTAISRLESLMRSPVSL